MIKTLNVMVSFTNRKQKKNPTNHSHSKSNNRPFTSNGLGLSLFEGLRERELRERSVVGEGEKEREKIKKMERTRKYN